MMRLSPQHMDIAARLWSIGCDTFGIAWVLGANEAHVYNELDAVRKIARTCEPDRKEEVGG